MSQTSRDRVNGRHVRTHKKNSGDVVPRLGTIIQSMFCAQSGASIRLTVWKWSRESWYTGALPPVLENFLRAFTPALGLRGCHLTGSKNIRIPFFGLASHVNKMVKKSHDQSSGRVGSNLTAAAAVSSYPVAQWWVHSPPTNSHGPGSLKSRLRWHYMGRVCCWFSSLLGGVFSGFSGFPSCQKQAFSKFQFDQESGRRRTTTIKSSNIYLFIYLFIYKESKLPILNRSK